MLPASTKAGGQCFAMPDVCMVPAPIPAGGVPTPFPNTASPARADKTTTKVLFVNKEVVTVKSEIPRSQGDEPGVSMVPTPKGVVSQTNMGKCTFLGGSSKVKAEGESVVYLGVPTAHNGGANPNAPGAQVAPSQTKVLVMP
ncbi:MAG: DUF4150 domain-containing protein [Myxococcales bacterium]|nr:DUF4150 domain-containing protein [Myxococcales bacterium]